MTKSAVASTPAGRRATDTSTLTGSETRDTNDSTPALNPPRVERRRPNAMRKLARLELKLLGMRQRFGHRLRPRSRSRLTTLAARAAARSRLARDAAGPRRADPRSIRRRLSSPAATIRTRDAANAARLSAFAIAVATKSVNEPAGAPQRRPAAAARRANRRQQPPTAPSTMIGVPTAERTPRSRAPIPSGPEASA